MGSPVPPSLFSALGRSAELLGLDPTQLTDALTQRSMFLRGEEILTPLSVQQVCMPPVLSAMELVSDVVLGFSDPCLALRYVITMNRLNDWLTGKI